MNYIAPFVSSRIPVMLVMLGSSANNTLHSLIHNSANESHLRTAFLVRKLIYIRENILPLSNNVVLAREDITQFVCIP